MHKFLFVMGLRPKPLAVRIREFVHFIESQSDSKPLTLSIIYDMKYADEATETRGHKMLLRESAPSTQEHQSGVQGSGRGIKQFVKPPRGRK